MKLLEDFQSRAINDSLFLQIFESSAAFRAHKMKGWKRCVRRSIRKDKAWTMRLAAIFAAPALGQNYFYSDYGLFGS